MILNTVPYKVLLPRWIWEEAEDKEHFKKLVMGYMERYPHYKVVRIQEKFAICVRK